MNPKEEGLEHLNNGALAWSAQASELKVKFDKAIEEHQRIARQNLQAQAKEIFDDIVKLIEDEHKYKQYWRDKAKNIINLVKQKHLKQ